MAIKAHLKITYRGLIPEHFKKIHTQKMRRKIISLKGFLAAKNGKTVFPRGRLLTSLVSFLDSLTWDGLNPSVSSQNSNSIPGERFFLQNPPPAPDLKEKVPWDGGCTELPN